MRIQFKTYVFNTIVKKFIFLIIRNSLEQKNSLKADHNERNFTSHFRFIEKRRGI